MLGIDLSKAFDCLQYGEMLRSLRDTGMPETLCRVLLHIHMRTTLLIEHCGHSREVRMCRGLRQGCGIAPMIYACWTIRLCKVLDGRLRTCSDATWTQDHMSIFADDKHCYWDIDSCSAFTQTLQHIGVIIDTILELGMKINFQKSLVNVALKGTKAGDILKKHFKQWNGQRCLVLRRSEHDIYIPVGANMQYLGAILNYHNFELETAKLRCRQANSNFAQLAPVLRTNSQLSQARKLEVYRACVWSSLVYGITATGLTPSVCRTLTSTAAMHLRKLLKIYDKGHSNHQVLQRAGLELLPNLERRLARQAHALQLDVGRDARLRHRESTRLEQIRAQLNIVQTQDITKTIAPQDPSGVAHVPCPVCGVYFNNVEGLHQHLHRQHAHVEQEAKIAFDRSKHSLFGLPFCRFCRTRKSSWQSLTKHITQGMCLRLKAAFAKHQTIDQLLADIQEEELRDPPQPPAGDTLPPTHSVDDMHIRTIARNRPLADLHQRSSLLITHASQCLLCGQRVLQASRIKSHWRQSHAQVWKQSGHHAIAEAQSLSALFSTPCLYFGSAAKNSKLHAAQCPMMFQILALRWLEKAGPLRNVADLKPAAPRKHEARPKYKSFTSPMQLALAKGAQPCINASKVLSSMVKLPLKLTPPKTTDADTTQVGKEGVVTKKIHPLFQQRQRPMAEHVEYSLQWLHRLRLRNPHAMCYVNAAILALLLASLDPAPALIVPELQFLLKLGKKAANELKDILLPQMHKFRQLTPHWVFDSVQKDTAEYLHAVFNTVSSLQITWDTRSFAADGTRLRSSGTQPLLVPIDDSHPQHTDLQALKWHHADSDVTGLTHPAELLCIQLGRYYPGGKRTNSITLTPEVRVPCFNESSEPQWWTYRVCSAIIHLGRTPLAGHYRALLRDQLAWRLADDSRSTVSVNLHPGHLRNIYVVLLRRVGDGALPDEAAPSSC